MVFLSTDQSVETIDTLTERQSWVFSIDKNQRSKSDESHRLLIAATRIFGGRVRLCGLVIC